MAYVRTIWDLYFRFFHFPMKLAHSLFKRPAPCLVQEYRQYLCLCESSEEEETCEEIERLFRAVDEDSSSSSSEASKKSKSGAGSGAKPKDTAKRVKKVKKDKKAGYVTLYSNQCAMLLMFAPVDFLDCFSAMFWDRKRRQPRQRKRRRRSPRRLRQTKRQTKKKGSSKKPRRQDLRGQV